MQLTFFSGRPYSPKPDEVQSLVPAAGIVSSLWIWRRFGLWYAFLAAMIFVIFLPHYWTSSHSAQHVTIALLYAIGLILVAAVRPRHRFDYLADAYSLVEALLWLGIYLAMNLQLSWLNMREQWLGIHTTTASQFAPVLLDNLGPNLVPAAPRTRARHSPEGPLRHCGGRDRRRPDIGLE
jgi:hypothetical protein